MVRTKLKCSTRKTISVMLRQKTYSACVAIQRTTIQAYNVVLNMTTDSRLFLIQYNKTSK